MTVWETQLHLYRHILHNLEILEKFICHSNVLYNSPSKKSLWQLYPQKNYWWHGITWCKLETCVNYLFFVCLRNPYFFWIVIWCYDDMMLRGIFLLTSWQNYHQIIYIYQCLHLKNTAITNFGVDLPINLYSNRINDQRNVSLGFMIYFGVAEPNCKFD